MKKISKENLNDLKSFLTEDGYVKKDYVIELELRQRDHVFINRVVQFQIEIGLIILQDPRSSAPAMITQTKKLSPLLSIRVFRLDQILEIS